jgi:hypothetical protein
MEKEIYTLIAKRVPPGDRFVLIDDKTNTVHSSLTETLEAYYQSTQLRVDFKLSPLKGELYIITNETVAPEPPKKFNIYGDY